MPHFLLPLHNQLLEISISEENETCFLVFFLHLRDPKKTLLLLSSKSCVQVTFL